jgi:hypothetical protein
MLSRWLCHSHQDQSVFQRSGSRSFCTLSAAFKSAQPDTVLSLSTMYIRCAILAFASMVTVNAQSLLPPLTLPPLTYDLIVSHIGSDFLDNYSWETADDPTNGRVNYVDKATALKDNLTFGICLLSHSIFLLNFLQFRAPSLSCVLIARGKLQNLTAGEPAYAYIRWMPTMTSCSSLTYHTCPRVVQHGLRGGH